LIKGIKTFYIDFLPFQINSVHCNLGQKFNSASENKNWNYGFSYYILLCYFPPTIMNIEMCVVLNMVYKSILYTTILDNECKPLNYSR